MCARVGGGCGSQSKGENGSGSDAENNGSGNGAAATDNGANSTGGKQKKQVPGAAQG